MEKPKGYKKHKKMEVWIHNEVKSEVTHLQEEIKFYKGIMNETSVESVRDDAESQITVSRAKLGALVTQGFILILDDE